MLLRSIVAFAIATLSLPLFAADWTIGYEGSDDWSHAFLTVTQPVSRAGAGEVIAWGTLSYIRYDLIEGGARRDVSAPGVGGGVLWRWSDRQGSLEIGPGYEVRRIERQGTEARTESGLTFRADGFRWLSESVIVTGGATYYDSIEWTAARASLEYRLAGDLRVGPEVAYQGNGDISVNQTGGILRYPVSDQSSLWIRAGTARTEFSDGTRRDDPYFSAGVGYTIRY